MNVEIETEAAQFPEKEFINGIFAAVYRLLKLFMAWRIYKSLTDTWMWKLGTEAAQFPEKKYINGTFAAVYRLLKTI